MKVCRICLSSKGRLYAMNKHLKSLYQHLTGLNNADARLPQWVCAECGLRVLSFDKLRQKSLRAYKFLCQILDKSKYVTKKNMLEINSLRLESSFTYSNINLAVYNPDIDNNEEETCTINFSESDLLVPKEEKEDPLENSELFAYTIIDNEELQLKNDAESVKSDLEPEYCEIEFLEEEKNLEENKIQNNVEEQKIEENLDKEKIEENMLVDTSIKSDKDYVPPLSVRYPKASKKSKLKKGPVKKNKKGRKISKKASHKKVQLKIPKKEQKKSLTMPVEKENDLKKFFKSFLPSEKQEVEIDTKKEYNLQPKDDTEIVDNDMEAEYCDIEFLDEEIEQNESDFIDGDYNLHCDKINTQQPLEAKSKKEATRKKGSAITKKKESKLSETKQTLIEKDVELKKEFTIIELSIEEQINEIERRKDVPEYAAANYKCDVCFKWFTGKEAYDDHMLKHSLVSGTFECRVCRVRCKTDYALKCHLRRTHGKLFKCNSCHFVTTVRGSAVRHGKLHSGGVTYLCPHCVRQFNDPTLYWRHMRVFHNSSADVCAACGLSFLSKKGLRVHRVMKHPGLDFEIPMEGPRCEKCNITFASEEAYATHIRVSVKHRDDTIKAKRKKYEYKNPGRQTPCEECGLQLDNFQAYANHFRRSHPEKTLSQQYPKCESCMCDFCGQLLRDSTALNKHMTLKHDVESARLYVCRNCSKKFSQALYLTKHYKEVHKKDIQVSSDLNATQCHECGKVMASKGSLQAHQKIHDVDRPRRFTCDQCCKSFYSNCRLQRHMTIHIRKKYINVNAKRVSAAKGT